MLCVQLMFLQIWLCGADCGDDEWLRGAGGGGYSSYRSHRNTEILSSSKFGEERGGQGGVEGTLS